MQQSKLSDMAKFHNFPVSICHCLPHQQGSFLHDVKKVFGGESQRKLSKEVHKWWVRYTRPAKCGGVLYVEFNKAESGIEICFYGRIKNENGVFQFIGFPIGSDIESIEMTIAGVIAKYC